eukprot:g2738.t1
MSAPEGKEAAPPPPKKPKGPKPEKSGYVIKRGGQIKTWKTRWMVLLGTTLSYYEDKEKALKGTIELRGY